MGICSRREAEAWIAQKKISVNGQVVEELGLKITPGVDQVSVDGRLVENKAPPRVYWLLHKPDKTLTSTKSQGGKATIFDLPSLKSLKFNLSSIGRLDYRTEGLLLLSNDGELVHRLSHPKYKLPRHYYVLTNSKLTAEQEKELRLGLTLEDGPIKKVEIQHAHGQNLGKSKGSWYFVTVFEGRNRLVRRIFEHFDKKVVRLVRYGFGDLKLPETLKPGEYVQLDTAQIHQLKKFVDLK